MPFTPPEDELFGDPPATDPPDEEPDYTDGTWYVPAGSNSYVKKPKE